MSCPLFAQDVTVCVGWKSLYRTVGEQGSVFNYDVPETGGRLLSNYGDSIVMEWGYTRGLFSLGVQETSKYGCPGEWAYLDVAVVGAEIKLDKDEYIMCGDSVQITFNDSDFRAYSWSDRTIRGNFITKTGTYELQAIDRNGATGCLISKTVTVLPSPRVYLGKDTVICVPDRLFADRNGVNSPETTYTWSTGESTPYIYVYPVDQPTTYWVRADLGECSVSDTVVVLACKDEETDLLQWDIPNTITPNGDGDNDLWNIYSLRTHPNVVVEVYDRWGRRVFLSAKGYPEPWDGKDMDGRLLPLETYYYIIMLNDDKYAKPIIGNITIVR
jgi:gliding motility-associated-like protein